MKNLNPLETILRRTSLNFFDKIRMFRTQVQIKSLLILHTGYLSFPYRISG